VRHLTLDVAFAPSGRRTRQSSTGRHASLIDDDELALTRIGRLACGIAHEANKPLYVIEHHLRQLLREGRLDERRLRAMAIEVANLRRLIAELQAYARSPSEGEHIAIGEVLDRALERAPEGLEVRVVGARALRAALDATLLVHLFQVLLDNAARSGARSVEIAVGRERGDLVIAVADDGPGIPQALEPRVFEPLFTTRRTDSSSGLGLAIAHEIALAHGGALVLVPSARGARFELRLPAPRL
jgi:signal transduction histidine kinase